MSNLYGGMPGSKFILKSSFPSVDDMVAAFKLGPNYTNVWYEEYCLIDTFNKNHTDNGKLYRRGYDYTNNMGGAEYIGQIVGPRSGTPYMQINTLEQAHARAAEELTEDEFRQYPYGQNADGTYQVTSDNEPIADFTFTREDALVPGRNTDGTYNDEIKWTWVNIRRNNEETGSWFYIGFQIPYLVIDYDAKPMSPYDDEGVIKEDLVTLTKIDDATHPYYESYEFAVAYGIKGDALRHMRVITPTASDVIYDPSAITIREDGSSLVGTPGYEGQADDIANNRQIVVYDYYMFDRLKNPAPIMIYLGDYNQESGIVIDDDGTITFSQTHNDDIVFEKKLRWVRDISLTSGNGAAGGHFTVEYNNGDMPYETDITWPKNIEIAQDGTVTTTFAGAGDELTDHTTGIRTYVNLLKWISEITLNTTNGILEVGYNNNSEPFITTLDWIRRITLDDDGTIHFLHTANEYDEVYNQRLRWVTDASLNPTNGLLTITFNNGTDLTGILDYVSDLNIDEDSGNIVITHINSGDTTLAAKLKKIVSASVSENGVVTLTDNTGGTFNLQRTDGQGDYHWRSVDAVNLNTSLNEDHRIRIKYNDQTSEVPIGNPLNWVEDMVIRDSDWHLLVLFADPSHRATANDLDANGKDAAGNQWVQNVLRSDGRTTTQSGIYWRDYGAVKDQSGVLIGTTVTDDDIAARALVDSSVVDILTYLQSVYPNGMTTERLKGKVVTYSPQRSDEKKFYAFDYNFNPTEDSGNPWFFLGTIADAGLRDVAISTSRSIPTEISQNLTAGGLVFTILSTTKSASEDLITTPMPAYWSYNYNSWQ